MLTIFDVCGGCNSGLSKLSRYRNCIYFLHSSLAIVLIWYTTRLVEIYYSKILLLEAISECLQYITALSTYCLIIFDSMVFHREHRAFWAILQQIDGSYNSQTEITFRSYMVKFGAYLLKTILFSTLRLCTPIVSFDVDAAYIYLFTICEVRIFYYIFCVEILNFQLNAIDQELHETVAVDTVLAAPFPRFGWIRAYSHTIHKMSRLLNKVFGWSNVSTISFCFFFLLTEIHWFYIHYKTMLDIYKICNYFWSFLQFILWFDK